MRVRFLSGNKHKISEAIAILRPVGVEVVPLAIKVEELQNSDIHTIVNDKVTKAFHMTGHPLFVEHTGLFIDSLKGFPGGLTQVFWDTLQADTISKLFGQGINTGVTARTIIGYCDGRRICKFEGELRGNIAPEPRGNTDFQWDCVFIPEGHSETFAEMGTKKNEISMRRRALDAFSAHLTCTRHA
jgi:XTP/dITP diphosphohydrolase